jgi:stage II sporulation protein D
MKAIISACLLLIVLVTPVMAEESIRVLMSQGTGVDLPSGDAGSLGKVNGEVIFNGHLYKGRLEVLSDRHGLYIINNIPLERYVEEVVASETGENWELEALKAQAVISRTYAIYKKEENHARPYHITSGIMDQLYEEKITDPLISLAVEETGGEILTYNGRPIRAYYHAICIGKTEVPEEVWGEGYPYLRSVDCNARATPYDSWQRRFSLQEIGGAIGLEGIEDITIGSYTSTGRVRTIKIIARGSSPYEMRATELRRLLGYRRLPSTHFSVKVEDGEAVFDGRGWGHGVGLCQWGALEMARQGKSYREILAHYYPGAVLTTLSGGD